ncbi:MULTISPECIES: hypothetical protein [unclassified Devosia]|uniref:hypothetical protein n=1 Tax=unclassified Devosia TaxID=196773 RepID=UPI00086F8ECF|nr:MULTISPECIES: hypothetical protein [unclassified Devosia]MBN9361663.1 hypothetical protein [Devosia sp.]ODS81695.1 MAG: hypothetical protein ABS47_23990 [Devosia sp. SCN 66-27]OJX26705.1 MAG: hypothetical protein BGO83_22885 [Devosia sp. 66-14]
MSSRWRETSPEELAGWLSEATAPWGIAGGWALDLWQGGVSRLHSDIEISCFLADLPTLLPRLAGFEVAIARNKQLTPHQPGAGLPPPPFSLWLRRHGETLWDFEIVAEAQAAGQWAYRREPSIRRPLTDTFIRTASGWPVIAPEIQLLYKCKQPRDKDLLDLRRYVPALDAAAGLWLRSAVAIAHPEFLPTLLDIEALHRGDGGSSR